MKRQSTTARITIATATLIESDCCNGNGVIIRHRGKELGCESVFRVGRKVFFKVRETSALIPREQCTILKTTIAELLAPARLTINVGCNRRDGGKNGPWPTKCEIAWGGLFNRTIDNSVKAGEWNGVQEATIVSRGTTTIPRYQVIKNLVRLCERLGQDAIAVEFDGVGQLVWHPDYSEGRYSFDPTYFVR